MSAQPIIEHFDVFNDVLCCLVPCAVLAMIDELALQSPEEALHAGVVPTASPPGHAGVRPCVVFGSVAIGSPSQGSRYLEADTVRVLVV